MRILIVDDSIDSRRLLIKYLSTVGQCDVATDGKEAVRAVQRSHEKNEPYDIIILDILMPNMDGHKALSEIRKLEESEDNQLKGSAKIIMATVLSDKKNVMAAIKGLCDAYLLKPFNKNALFEKLEELGVVYPIVP